MAIRSPVRWIGGKGRHAAKILPFFPSHHCYVEPFGGGASVLLAKNPSAIEVYNDIDANVTGLFIALQSRGKDVFSAVAMTPYSRYEHIRSRTRLQYPRTCIVAYRQSFGGNRNCFGPASTATNNDMAMTVASYLGNINKLPVVSRRFKDVVIHNEDALQVIKRYDSKTTLFYLDPPYVASSWGAKEDLYEQVMSDRQHKKLLAVLKKIQGMAVLSGYENKLYDKLDWEKYTFDTTSSLAPKTKAANLKGKGKIKKNQSRTECIWINKATSLGLKKR